MGMGIPASVGNHVGWGHYASFGGGGGGFAEGNQVAHMLQNPQEREALMKALTIGYNSTQPTVGPGVGFPNTVQSLEATLANASWAAWMMTMWRMIPKRPAYNTREEFNRINKYGLPGIMPFVSESGTPATIDSEYERAYVDIKYMSVLAEISLVAALIKPAHGNLIGQENVAKTMFLLGALNSALYYGSSTLSSLQFDGLDKQIADNVPATHIIDKRSAPLDEDDLSNGALTIGAAGAYGRASHLISGPEVRADLVKQFFPRMRVDTMQPQVANGYIGGNIAGFEGPQGKIEFVDDIFINPGQGLGPEFIFPSFSAVGAVGERPATPTRSTAATTPVNGDTLFVDADDDIGAGFYYYFAAVNDKGISAPVLVNTNDTTPIVPSAGDSVTFGMTPGGSNEPETKYWLIFRTRKGEAASKAMLIARVPNEDADGETVFTDLNENLPGCTSAYLMQFDAANVSWLQLAPLMGVPFGTQALSFRKALVLFGSPLVRIPKHHVIFRNVGRPVGAKGLYTTA